MPEQVNVVLKFNDRFACLQRSSGRGSKRQSPLPEGPCHAPLAGLGAQ